MARRVIKHGQFLKQLCQAKPKSRQTLLKLATPEQIRSVCEVCLNIYNRNIPVAPNRIKSLHRHKKVLKTISVGTQPLSKKKQLLIQKGGFLPILAPILAGLLPAILENIL
jgi:hypothetical protein